MTTKELEEKIYEYGHVMYRLGRMETDGNTTTKEYNKFCNEKEKLVKEFDEHFGSSGSFNKIAKTLGV
jgi:hypothetical protein